MAPTQPVELRYEARLLEKPALVFLDHLRTRPILAYHERIAPHARPTDVDHIRHRAAELLLIVHSRRLNLLHRCLLSVMRPRVRRLDAAWPERGASAAEGRNAGGGSPDLAGHERSDQPKDGDTSVADEALAQ